MVVDRIRHFFRMPISLVRFNFLGHTYVNKPDRETVLVESRHWLRAQHPDKPAGDFLYYYDRLFIKLPCTDESISKLVKEIKALGYKVDVKFEKEIFTEVIIK